MSPDDSLISLADYERAAEGLLDRAVGGYVLGGAADEVTLRDNILAWQRIPVRPQMLTGVEDPALSTSILGQVRPHPVVIAPMAAQALADPEGELATARAAASSGTVMCLSTFASFDAAAVARAVPDGCRWFQLYVLRDRGLSDEHVARAVEQRYEALVVTVDVPAYGVRERELRFPIEEGPSDAAATIDPSLTWKDIEHFASEFPLPVLVKGLLTAQDARLAVAHGASAVVVSNHGGRQLDTVSASADALPAVVDAVGEQIDVLVDGGIRRGTDVLKALALGARAVLLGRPVFCGLAVDGADGVGRVLEILLAELQAALVLAGIPSVAAVDRTFVGPCRG